MTAHCHTEWGITGQHWGLPHGLKRGLILTVKVFMQEKRSIKSLMVLDKRTRLALCGSLQRRAERGVASVLIEKTPVGTPFAIEALPLRPLKSNHGRTWAFHMI